ncbi:MAG TPA: UbiA prenyltransferase family protein [Bryobacteraceae bacterium]|nr:UbiA prenyltransferase family protein [Bryobacteraceae bacterium]
MRLETDPPMAATAAPTLAGHVSIARFDHWVKNVFVLPGIVIALSVDPPRNLFWLGAHIILGLLAVGLVASSNYTINEVLDAPYDRWHPTKRLRPVPSGKVSIPLAYLQWILLMVAGVGISATISTPLTITMIALWIMGILYNVPPIRLKDRVYLDVLSESVNNPLRMLAGWYMVTFLLPPPGSLLVSYWMIGCYFMAIKRFAEYREIGNPAVSAAYRKSFSAYSERRLLVSIMFYGAFAMLAFGGFAARYRLELVLAYPLVALVMAVYLNLAFKPDGAAHAPELLYRDRFLVLSVAACAAALMVLYFVDVPMLRSFFNSIPSPIPARN